MDPTTNEPAPELLKEKLIKTYLTNKFEEVKPLESTSYPLELIPDMETIEYLRANADLRKTTGYDFIPYQALKYKVFREIVAKDLQQMLIKNTDTQPFFDAKLTLFNKNKSGMIPNTS